MSRLSRSRLSEGDSVACSAKMDGMHVSVRIRPLSNSERANGMKPCCLATSNASLVITKAGDSGAYLKSQATQEAEFAFDAVFDEFASQSEVYDRSAKPYLSKLITGENVTIFAYGATGAGKTHTMFGNTRFDSTAAFAGAGIIPQSVADLFRLIHERQEDAQKGELWSVTMNYMEVYNEQVCDLLDVSNKNLPLREDPERGVVKVAGLSEHKVNNYDEVLELLMKGQVNRKTEATKANIVSSRSHAILQFTLVHTRRGPGATNITSEAKLSLIDLAGSERASATQNTGARLQEGANINKSLLALANCINALSERATSSAASFSSPRKVKKTNVKYRDSKLTHLLKGSLEGNCNLIMIANVNPADSSYDESYRTLQYANRAKNLKVKPGMREIGAATPAAEREARLKEENEELRKKLAALEQNAQQANASEKQLLQALAQAMDELNAAKAQQQASPTRSPVLRGAVAMAQAVLSPVRASLSAATSPLRFSPVPSALPAQDQAMEFYGAPVSPVHSRVPSPMRGSPVRSPVPAPSANNAGRSASPMRRSPPVSAEPSHHYHAAPAPLSGKKTKRESTSPEDSRLSGASYNPRRSSTCSIYPADGDDEDGDYGADENYARMSVDSCRSLRPSLDQNSPKKRLCTEAAAGGQSNRPVTRLSSGSTASQQPNRVTRTSMDRVSIGSAPGGNGLSFSKPTRLSEELVRQYEVLANVTSAAVRRMSNTENRQPEPVADNDLKKGRESYSSTGDAPCAAPNGRGSFPSAVHGSQWNTAATEPSGAFNIDARYQYSHGARDTTPPKQGFLSRFLCGINKRR